MPYLCDLFFIFRLNFNAVNHITSLKHAILFVHFLEYLLLFLDNKVDEESEQFSNCKNSVSGCCLAFAELLPISAWRCL